VMYLGSIVEIGETEPLFAKPAHPYTAALLAAAPEMDPTRRGTRDAIAGELPSPFDVPSGCAFRTRCSRASDRCAAVRPTLAGAGDGRLVACHHPLS
jgi:oligopeptide/dipeptide ABC transporter ATP-binding protein